MVLDEPKENDDSYEFEGLTYLIDKGLSVQTGKVTVDYMEQGWQQGFVLNSENPIGGGSSCGGSCSSGSCG